MKILLTFFVKKTLIILKKYIFFILFLFVPLIILYVTEYNNGTFHGQKTYTFSNGGIYFGEFKNGKLNGHGAMSYYGYGSTYVGEWKNNTHHGQGIIMFYNADLGMRYVGEVKKGVPQDQDFYSFQNPYKNSYIFTYKGSLIEFNEDIFEEKEALPFPQCEISGKVVITKTLCYGTFTFVNDENIFFKYRGEFKDGVPHGRGSFFYPDESIYWGDIKEAKLYGYGSTAYSNGNRFVGEWKDDHRNGKGVFTFANGDEYVGEFKDDQFNGKGKLTYKNGDIEEGVFENNYLISTYTK
jgi:hypothetical protein